MIENRHIIITGFLQNISTPNGMDKIYLNLMNFNDKHTVVDMKVWNSHWKPYARFVERTGPGNYANLDIRCYGYSWGCGYGFITLAKELRKLGISINYAVLSDPVYYPGILKHRALFNFFYDPVIVVPDNVKEVYYFRQQNNRPKGHQVIAADQSKTIINDMGYIPGVIHQSMDDSPIFRNLCISVAQKNRGTHGRSSNCKPKD